MVVSSMIHSKYRIADQLIFSIDVLNTLSAIADQLLCQESEETFLFLYTYLQKEIMLELTPGTYSVGSSALSREERRAIQVLSTLYI